jgi:hypothetical protein
LRHQIAFALLALLSGVASNLAHGTDIEHCLWLEPGRVELEGTLMRRIEPGPPNYESIAAGDRPEPILMLDLGGTTCVEQFEGTGPTVLASEVQVALLTGVGDTAHLIGERVYVTGTLFLAESGHHHTAVLIHAEAIRRPN